MTFRHATHPDTKEQIRAHETEAMLAEWVNVEALKCDHNKKGIRTVLASNGAPQIYEVCLRCGTKLTQALSKSKYPEIPLTLDVSEISEKFHSDIALKKFNIIKKYADIEQRQGSDFAKQYGEYLRSDAWKKKRLLVLKRANYICEGCGELEAEEVHHLTYEHRLSEMLYELVALCATCHSMVHFDKNPNLRFNNKEDISIICHGCRYQSEQNNTLWCYLHDVPAAASLKSETYCNSGKNGFEGLK